MKNFIFICPNFPTNYWKFCAELKKNGMNVLGIGDCPYDQLMPELRGALNEYYKVSSLENYDEVFPRGRVSDLQARQDRLAGEQQRILAGARRGAAHRFQHHHRSPHPTRYGAGQVASPR